MLPLLLLGQVALLAGVAGAITDGEPLNWTRDLDSDAPAYFRIRVPPGTKLLRVHAEADRPVALMAALGYLPTEAHYDVSNFPEWARGLETTDLRLPLHELREPACDPDGKLAACLSRISRGPGLQCGTPTAAPDTEPSHLTCEKFIGDCSFSGTAASSSCRSRQGPTLCDANSRNGTDACLCQPGFCAVSGRCVGADQVQQVQGGCFKITGRTCPKYDCGDEDGPANCEDGLCVCAPGYCAVGGVCMAGPLCEEIDAHELCDAASSNMGPRPGFGEASAANRRLLGIQDGDGADAQCCQRLDDARAGQPGHFARCAARHLRKLEDAISREVNMPLLAGWGVEGEDVVVSARVSMVGRSTLLPQRRSMDDDGLLRTIKVLFTATMEEYVGWGDVATPASAATGSELLAPLSHFKTVQELISPSLGAPSQSMESTIRQFEAPLLVTTNRSGHADAMGASLSPRSELRGAPASALPGVPPSKLPKPPLGALPLPLQKDQLVVLRLEQASLHGSPAMDGAAAGGSLQLHIVGLPLGSLVLYSRKGPEPRSLMDFGHAQPVPSEDLWGDAAWGAADARNARHFAVLPSEDAGMGAAAYFAVEPDHSQTTQPLLVDVGEVASLAPTGGIHQSDTTGMVWYLEWVLLALGCLLALYVWFRSIRRRGARIASLRRARSEMRYVAVAMSEPDAAAGGGLGSGDEEGTKRTLLEELQTFGGTVKEKFGQGDFQGLGDVTGRLLHSVSTRASSRSSSRISATSRRSMLDEESANEAPHRHSGRLTEGEREEARGLLRSGYENEEEDEDGEAEELQWRPPSPQRSSVHSPPWSRLPSLPSSPATEEPHQNPLGSCWQWRAPSPRKSAVHSPQCERRPSPPTTPSIDDGDDDDIAAVAALMKLRPAARDSVGDDEEDDPLSARPLVGTGRQCMLSR